MKFLRNALAGLFALVLSAAAANAACYQWSTTASANASGDPSINWAEGMAPSSVNDSARAMMARLQECRLDVSGSLTTAGTSTSYTLATNQGYDTLAHLDGQKLCFRLNVTNGTPVQLNVDALGLKPLRSAPSVELNASVIPANVPVCAVYNNSTVEFVLQDFYSQTVAANSITTAMLQNSAVTYAKIQNETTNTILGNVSGSPAPPQELTIGTGLLISGTTIKAPAFPPPTDFKNLVIKVATNTTVNASADFATVTDGTNFQTLAFSCAPIDLGSNGAVNKLDTGTIAIDTWYAIWFIAQANGTSGCLASTSFSAPTLPSGYTYKARMGAVQTIHASATLYGTFQFGKRAAYVVGLAQTTTAVQMASGTVGGLGGGALVGISLTRWVPPSATEIFGAGAIGPGTIILAPNNNYGAASSTTNSPPVVFSSGSNETVNYFMVIESTSIFWASNVTGQVYVSGWVDNL